MTTPRVFIIRHGETAWSLSGKHTGTTDIPLTANGERRIRATGHALVGHDRLIVPRNLAHVYVSPRSRAKRTLELLDLGCREGLPWDEGGEAADGDVKCEARVEVTENVREWDYGDYEGVTSKEIRERRRQSGEGEWDIWRDGCPGGEYVISILFAVFVVVPFFFSSLPTNLLIPSPTSPNQPPSRSNTASPDPQPTSPPAVTRP